MDVRITLEKPWAIDAAGKEIPLVLRYGSTQAREIGGGGQMFVGGESVSADDLNDAGSHMDVVPRAQRRVIPGKRIEWTFSFSDKELNGFFIPIEAAQLYFGNWRFPKESPVGGSYEESYNYERNRVAMKWGWWEMPQLSSSGQTHLRRGEESPDTTKIGAPRVPHVLIESVDNRGKTTGSVKYRPWDWFRWQDDVASSVSAFSKSTPPSIETFSAAQLRAIADEIEARQKTQKD